MAALGSGPWFEPLRLLVNRAQQPG
jgi:hypothetical protein